MSPDHDAPMSPKTTRDNGLHISIDNGPITPTKSHDVVEHREHREHDLDAPGAAVVGGETPELLRDAEVAWCRIRRYLQDPFSEFCGVFILILFGDGGVAQVVLSGGTKGSYQSISWAWGIGVMIGVYVARKSGGHLNPAVTFANCVFRRFPWRKFPSYLVAQTLGAMAGALVVYGNYRAAIDAFEGGAGVRTVGGNTSSAGIFCTYPAAFMTRTGMFFSEFVSSAILMFCIYAFLDAGAGDLLPLCLFFLLFGIGACFGWETGYAINLARDFGPRLVSYMVGYGTDVWSAGGYYFWIPMVAPFLGTTFGGFLHDVFLNDNQGATPINTPWMGLHRIRTPSFNNWTWSSRSTRSKSFTSHV